MTDNDHLQNLLKNLLETETELGRLQGCLKEMVAKGCNATDLVTLVQERQKAMQNLAQLDEKIETALSLVTPDAKSAAEALLKQVGARLAALTRGEQELLAAVENQIKGETKLHNKGQMPGTGGDKLDVSY